MESERPFKVIIVGAGVAGMTLAHCLAKAGIDFALLDKGVVGPPFGTTITLQPHGCRVLHQLGCLDHIISKCSYMGGATCRDSQGQSYASNNFFGVVKEYAGYDTKTLDRQQFLKDMYEILPDQSKVFERTRVVGVVETNGEVHVQIDDGREFIGDLVVGTDGVHSKMREIMWDAANTAHPGMISVDEKRVMTTTYKAIVALAKPLPSLSQHDMEITSHEKFSFLLLCQPDWISYIVHYKLPDNEQCTWPNRKRFTESEMNELAESMASCPVTDSVVFGELWKNTTKAQMISLEEGVLDHWYFGRTVLAGDSIHKVTPNSALGGNTGIEDAVVITNNLREILAKHPNKKPTDNEIRDAMKDYQDSRMERVKAVVKLGGDMTRMQAYDGLKPYFNQRWMTPWVGLDSLAQGIAFLAATAPKLNFVTLPGELNGKIPWQDTKSAPAAEEAKKSSAWSKWDGTFESLTPLTLAVLSTAFGVASVFIWSQPKASIPGFMAIMESGSTNITALSRMIGLNNQ